MTQKEKAAITIGVAIAAIWYWRTQISGQPVATVTTSEGFDLTPYGGPLVYPPAIVNLAQAIATAEGFYVTGSIPQQANNPGDLVVPGWTGTVLGANISVFDSVNAGWNALYAQLYLILTGGSAYYNLDMTITDMANVWTATQQASWASNVAAALGVTVSTPLWSVLS